jgi:hypothetical protein
MKKTNTTPVVLTYTDYTPVDYSLAEIRTIAERVIYLLGLEMKWSILYRLAQWGKPFTDRYQDIIEVQNSIVKKYLEPGEYSVRGGEAFVKCSQETVDFLSTKDTLQVVKLPIEVIEYLDNMVVCNVHILHQFI